MPQPYTHRAFGLCVRSTDPIPGLSLSAAPAVPDLRVWFNAPQDGGPESTPAVLCYPRDGDDEHGDGLRVWRLEDGARFRFRYRDGTEFLIDRAGTEIHASWPAESTLEDTSIYLLGPVLGFALRLRGIPCLHASAIDVAGQAVALLGGAQAGKSTTAAAFARLGHGVLTDDVAAILEGTGSPCIQPAYSQLRLWPDSAALLFGSEDALPCLTPTWSKRALNLERHGHTFRAEPLPLAAIYLLGDRTPTAGTQIEPVPVREALRTLLAHSYVGYLLDRERREQEFVSFARLAAAVPLRRVIAPDDRSEIFNLCSRILEDCEAIRCTASPTTAR
jgi:hypothetical protein